MIEAAYSEEGPESRSAEPSLCPHPWGGCSLHWQSHILLGTYIGQELGCPWALFPALRPRFLVPISEMREVRLSEEQSRVPEAHFLSTTVPGAGPHWAPGLETLGTDSQLNRWL